MACRCSIWLLMLNLSDKDAILECVAQSYGGTETKVLLLWTWAQLVRVNQICRREGEWVTNIVRVDLSQQFPSPTRWLGAFVAAMHDPGRFTVGYATVVCTTNICAFAWRIKGPTPSKLPCFRSHKPTRCIEHQNLMIKHSHTHCNLRTQTNQLCELEMIRAGDDQLFRA